MRYMIKIKKYYLEQFFGFEVVGSASSFFTEITMKETEESNSLLLPFTTTGRAKVIKVQFK